MITRLAIVDAFTRRALAGNPAAVVLLPADDRRDDAWMQAVAAEMNLSETAFVGGAAAPGAVSLRWFTPAAEVELCGHATLAAAHLLWELGLARPDEAIDFQTRFRGVLRCTRLPAEAGDATPPDGPPWIAMDFPADPARDAEPPAGLIEALGVRPVRVARSRYDWIVELATAAEVRDAAPDFAGLARFDTRGVALTAAGDRPDAVSRFFAPRHRINEDPVTGSLHCVLGPWWAPRLGKPTLLCEQASPRGGMLRVTWDEARPERVILAGQAVTVSLGELLV